MSDTVDSIFLYLAPKDIHSEKNSNDKLTIAGIHMVLIKETKLDPQHFMRERNLYVGESSKQYNGKLISITTTSSMNTTQQRCQIRSAIYNLYNSISDTDIVNCNRLFWMRNSSTEANRIWNLGKQLGITFTGDENQILEQLQKMEERDSKIKRLREEGNDDSDK